MRICRQISTGKIIEMQSHATAGTLIANAERAGFRRDAIEEREVTPVEYAALMAAQPKSREELNALILAKLAMNDLAIIRALAEGDLVRITAHNEAQAALRANIKEAIR